MLNDPPHDPKRRGEVDVEHRVPLLVGRRFNSAVPDISGIVHHDIDRAEAVERRRDEAFGKLGVRHAARDRLRFLAQFLDRRHGFAGRALVKIIENDLRAFARQLHRHTQPDPAPGTGHKRNAARKSFHVSPRTVRLSPLRFDRASVGGKLRVAMRDIISANALCVKRSSFGALMIATSYCCGVGRSESSRR